MAKAVFLDRDGVINEKAPEGGYITRWEDFRVLPGTIESIRELNRAGFFVVIVTNQRCVAKGLLTEADLKNLHRQMTESFTQAGATIDAIYYCPHELATCRCRKPAPGMLLDAAASHGIDLGASWMIGDSDIDVQAGKNAGCRTARLRSTESMIHERENGAVGSAEADVVAASLPDAIREILHAVPA